MKAWKEVAAVGEFEKTDWKLVDLGGERYIGLFKLDDGYFAIDGTCSHEKASLVLGEISDHEIMCPLHGARFDLRTGRHLSLPAVRPVASYPVKVEGDKIWIEIS
jgi:3-phenylpropionate/trans-cinnamate dioxygenase ferredoxin subunit